MIIILFMWLFQAVIAAAIAGHKNRSVPCWFIAGVLFGVFAILLVLVLPRRAVWD